MKTKVVLTGIILLLSVSSGLSQKISGKMKGGPTYELNGNTLIISGKGVMDNYFETTTPWWHSRKKIEEVIIGEGITHIGNYSFLNCDNLKKVTIPETVVSIGEQSFRGCVALGSIIIPQNVKTIEKYAFFGCSNLRMIDNHSPEPVKIGRIIGMETEETCILRVPRLSVSKYEKDEEWGKFQIVPLPFLNDDTDTSLDPISPGTGRYLIIAGYSRDRQGAEKIGRNLLDKHGYSYSVIRVNDTLYRVSIDSFDDEKKAKRELENWKKKPGIPEDSWIFEQK